MVKEGCLVISDISGFTGFLQDSELTHAQETLSALLNLLVEHTRSPLHVVDLEGDAVFAYAPEVSIEQGQALVGMMDNCYVAFREALNMMTLNTTCTCQACRLIPTLDLKQFVHYGSFVQQEIADHLRLVGPDVNLIHRLLKNTIAADTGFAAYAAYTAPAVEALRLEEALSGLATHSERTADMGEVQLYVKNMAQVWEQNREAVRMNVRPQEALAELEFQFPVERDRLWRYLTETRTRKIFDQADSESLEKRPDGEMGPGGVYVCAHGRRTVRHVIVDWRPPSTYTINMATPLPGTTGRVTTIMEPQEGGTRLRLLIGPSYGPFPFRSLGDLFGRLIAPKIFQQGARSLREYIEEEQRSAAGG